MHRVVRFHQTGGPEVLHLEEAPVPEPGPGEVLIRTRALGLNRAESMFRLGQYGTDPVFPSGIGYEAAGVVEALGDGVRGLSVGEAVSVVPSFTMTDYGVHGEAVLAPAHAVVAHPSGSPSPGEGDSGVCRAATGKRTQARPPASGRSRSSKMSAAHSPRTSTRPGVPPSGQGDCLPLR